MGMEGTCHILLLVLVSICNGNEVPQRIIYSTPNAPLPIGPYNQAVQLDNVVYVSGQIGLNSFDGQLGVGVVDQARQALTNVGELLRLAESDFSKVIKATVFLADIQDFEAVNEVYKEFFTQDFPARAAMQVGALPKEALVEVEVVAVSGQLDTTYVTEEKILRKHFVFTNQILDTTHESEE